jgi:hypothetical protein
LWRRDPSIFLRNNTAATTAAADRVHAPVVIIFGQFDAPLGSKGLSVSSEQLSVS